MALMGAAARAAARALMPSLVRHAYGATRAINYLRAQGYRYRRKQMLEDYREFAGRARYEEGVRSLDPDRLPSRAIIHETELAQPERSYRIFGEVRFYDYEARRYYSTPVSFYDNYLRTKSQWAYEFRRQFGDVYRRIYNQAITDFYVRAIEHNRGHLY